MSVLLQMRRARRRLMFLALRSLLRGVGFQRARAVGTWLGELQFRLAWRQRRRLQREVAQALGRPVGDASVSTLLREAYRVNNGGVLEMMAMLDRRQDEARLVARCDVDGLDRLRTALAQGRGAMLLACHMGNPALVAIRLARAGWPVSVLYREARMMSSGFLQQGMERYGIQGILANGGIRAYGQMLTALKQGRIVMVMMDQGVKLASDGLMQRFLGKDIPMSAGPAQLARTSRAPVLPLVMTGTTPRWRFEIRPPIPLGLAPLEAEVETLTRLTEQQVRDTPQLWSWHHRRWCKFPMAPRQSPEPPGGDVDVR